MRVEDLNPKRYVTTEIQTQNLENLAKLLTLLEEQYGLEFMINSGLRTKKDQERINPRVRHSAHLSGEAADINDPDGAIWSWLMDNMDLLIRYGLYLEARSYTSRWVHIQTRVPQSGNRIFIPSVIMLFSMSFLGLCLELSNILI